MSEELTVMQDISRRLDLTEIPYMITGSMAMSLYARPRMTRDIDIVIQLSANNVDRLITALYKFYYIDTDSARQAMFRPPYMFNVIHEQLVVKVDFIVRPDTDYARTA